MEATLHKVCNIISIGTPLLHDCNVKRLQPLLRDKDVVLLEAEAGAGVTSISVRISIRINVHHGGSNNLVTTNQCSVNER